MKDGQRFLFGLLRMLAPAALGAAGAAMLLVYPDGFYAFCAQVP